MKKTKLTLLIALCTAIALGAVLIALSTLFRSERSTADLTKTRALYAMQLDRLKRMVEIQTELNELELERSEILVRIAKTEKETGLWHSMATAGGKDILKDLKKDTEDLEKEIEELKEELLKIGDLDPGKGGVIDFAAALQLEIIKTNDLFKKQGVATRIAGESDKTYAKVVKLLTAAKKDLDAVNKNEVNALGNLTALGEANSTAIKEQIAQLEKLKGAFEAVMDTEAAKLEDPAENRIS